jgi:N utilization substance protein B
MGRTKQREEIVKLLYLHSMNGFYNEGEFSLENERKVASVLPLLPEIDKLISSCLVNYTIDRLNYVDLAIIRYAVYEMQHTDVPYEIAINEAVELTKKYTNLDDDKAKAFNNRLLDNIKTKLKVEKG